MKHFIFNFLEFKFKNLLAHFKNSRNLSILITEYLRAHTTIPNEMLKTLRELNTFVVENFTKLNRKNLDDFYVINSKCTMIEIKCLKDLNFKMEILYAAMCQLMKPSTEFERATNQATVSLSDEMKNMMYHLARFMKEMRSKLRNSTKPSAKPEEAIQLNNYREQLRQTLNVNVIYFKLNFEENN